MTAELQQLKEREQQLESRNALLEKLNQLNAAKPQHAMEGTSLVWYSCLIILSPKILYPVFITCCLVRQRLLCLMFLC